MARAFGEFFHEKIWFSGVFLHFGVAFWWLFGDLLFFLGGGGSVFGRHLLVGLGPPYGQLHGGFLAALPGRFQVGSMVFILRLSSSST